MSLINHPVPVYKNFVMYLLRWFMYKCKQPVTIKGGYVRDKMLGRKEPKDIDMVIIMDDVFNAQERIENFFMLALEFIRKPKIGDGRGFHSITYVGSSERPQGLYLTGDQNKERIYSVKFIYESFGVTEKQHLTFDILARSWCSLYHIDDVKPPEPYPCDNVFGAFTVTDTIDMVDFYENALVVRRLNKLDVRTDNSPDYSYAKDIGEGIIMDLPCRFDPVIDEQYMGQRKALALRFSRAEYVRLLVIEHHKTGNLTACHNWCSVLARVGADDDFKSATWNHLARRFKKFYDRNNEIKFLNAAPCTHAGNCAVAKAMYILRQRIDEITPK